MSTALSRWGPVLTTRRAAEYVGFEPQTLRVMKCEGTGPKSFKQGRLNVYYPADLDAWLDERLVEECRELGLDDLPLWPRGPTPLVFDAPPRRRLDRYAWFVTESPFVHTVPGFLVALFAGSGLVGLTVEYVRQAMTHGGRREPSARTPSQRPVVSAQVQAARSGAGDFEWKVALTVGACGAAVLLLNALTTGSGIVNTLEGAWYWIPTVLSWLLLVVGPFVFGTVFGGAVLVAADNAFVAILVGVVSGFGIGWLALVIAHPWAPAYL